MMGYNYTLIIPHYDIPSLLRRLLKSVPRRDDLQVIVVDDCSSRDLDEYDKLREEYKWVEWHDTGINGGGGKARNIGLGYAKGKYVIFADADDIFEPNFNQALDDYIDQDYDIIYFDGVSRDSKTNELSNRTNHLTGYINDYLSFKDFNANGLKYLFGEPWCKFINKRLIEEFSIKFDETKIHNDTTFAYLIGYYSKNIHVDQRKIYCVTTRKGSVSVSINDERILMRVEVFSRAEKFLTSHNISTFSMEHYVQCVRLFVHLRLKLFYKCTNIMHNNKLSYGHIYICCLNTLFSIILNKFNGI